MYVHFQECAKEKRVVAMDAFVGSSAMPPLKSMNRKQSKHGIKTWSKHDEHPCFDENH
jgi:hypothetical protein